jgi:hypothetical protein
MEYHFYPPFFVVAEEHSFSDAWEAFCCKLLNLDGSRSDIYRREPPESGIDLYCAATKTAFQCKSVESGRAGAFDPAKAIESLQAARSTRDTVPWDHYVLCTNVDLTGTAEAKLRREHGAIDLRPRSYWAGVCERFPAAVERNFRRLLSVPKETLVAASKLEFPRHYDAEVVRWLAEQPIEVLFYSRCHDRVYRIPASLALRVEDVTRMLVRAFKLPLDVSSPPGAGPQFLLSHGLAFEEKRLPREKTLGECGVTAGSLVVLCTDIVVLAPGGDFHATFMHRSRMTGEAPRDHRWSAVVSECEAALQAALDGFARSLDAEAT